MCVIIFFCKVQSGKESEHVTVQNKLRKAADVCVGAICCVVCDALQIKCQGLQE